ncbi:hypothetical protein BMS3Abin01_00026 [bacterium BMS3Abin01]|nr:hypothetical protein BMS3Abin01_00026 [bacterium BMS3Abin01]
MEDMKTIEAFTVVGFGLFVMVFTIGELIVTWRRELRHNRCDIC